MPENEGNPNYDTIVAKLREQDEKIAKLLKENAEIIALNRSLLVTAQTTTPQGTNNAKEKEELGKKLQEALR